MDTQSASIKLIPKVTVTKETLTDAIMGYEETHLDVPELFALFSYLIASGAWASLQGRYGRTAQSLINAGWFQASGDYTEKALNELKTFYPDSLKEALEANDAS